MTNKKELDLDELEKVSGGVMNEQAEDWGLENFEVIYKLADTDPVKFQQVYNKMMEMEEDSRVYTKEDLKQMLINDFGFKASDFTD